MPTCTNLKAASLPPAGRASLWAQVCAHAQGIPDRFPDSFPSEVNDSWALEAGACQNCCPQNVGLLSLASF